VTRLRPILVTGAPRSGTTWTGRMLAASPRLYYLYEPFNPNAGEGRAVCGCRFDRYFTYIHPGNESRFERALRRMLQGRYSLSRALMEARSLRDVKRALRSSARFAAYRREGRVPLVKDPIALLSAGWMAERFDLQVVVLIRHPAAFVSSMARLKWPFRPARWALSQPQLMQDYLEPLRAELEELESRGESTDPIDQAALLWKTLHTVIRAYYERYPGWIFVRHEDLSKDPIAQFRSLYDRLGLEFTDHAQILVERYSGSGNPATAQGTEKTIRLNSKANIQSWKRKLSAEDVERIRHRVGDVAEAFYSDSEW